MRSESIAVKLPRGDLLIPLDMDTFFAVAAVPEDPAKKTAAGVDPGKVLRGEQDLPLVTRWQVLHAAMGAKSPGIKAIAAMGNDKDMTVAVATLMVHMLKLLSPELAGAEGPKA